METDADRWFLSEYKYKGKAMTYYMRYGCEISDPILIGGEVKYGKWTFWVPAPQRSLS
jgi:hypothetical protein